MNGPGLDRVVAEDRKSEVKEKRRESIRREMSFSHISPSQKKQYRNEDADYLYYSRREREGRGGDRNLPE